MEVRSDSFLKRNGWRDGSDRQKRARAFSARLAIISATSLRPRVTGAFKFADELAAPTRKPRGQENRPLAQLASFTPERKQCAHAGHARSQDAAATVIPCENKCEAGSSKRRNPVSARSWRLSTVIPRCSRAEAPTTTAQTSTADSFDERGAARPKPSAEKPPVKLNT